MRPYEKELLPADSADLRGFHQNYLSFLRSQRLPSVPFAFKFFFIKYSSK
jgi:hypothetical protein